MLVAVTIVASSLLLFFAERQRTRASEALEARVVGTADMLTVAVALGLRSTDLTGLARAMGYARRDPAIRWVVVVDTQGTPIAEYASNGEQAPTPAGNAPDRRIVKRGDVLTIAQPLLDGDEPLGRLHLGVSLSAVEAVIEEDLRLALVVVLGISMLAVIFGVVVSRRISRPIEELRDVAVRFREGEHPSIRISGSAETAELGNAFRSMAERIRDTMAALTAQTIELASSRDVALGATKTKSLFLATMSHELRTPMTGVLGMLDLLSRTSLSGKQQTFARTARDSAESLLVLIDDILDFSKIEAGKLNLETVPFDPRSIAEDVASLLAERAQRKGLALVCDIGADVPTSVVGDPTRLRQILLNLSGNAVKFTSTGEVRIVVRVGRGRGRRTVVRYTVLDTGPGITPEAQAQLFSAFSQADASTTRHFGGTGLGLSICKGLIGLMGGHIEVVSTLGKGSEFRVEVPFELAEAGRPDAPNRLAHKRVLLVHASDAQRGVIESYLRREGASVEVRDTLVAALADELPQVPHVVILSSAQSPEPVEQQLAQLREASGTAAARVILLVTLDSPVFLEDEFSAVLTLPLPVRRQALIDEVFASDQVVVPQRSGSESRMAATGQRILVVEDHPVNRLIAKYMLHELGHDVLLADNGEQALAVLSEESVDLILMDCQMPVMDGFEATRELRRREDGRERTPVIALTANAVKGDREACLAAGMDDYLTKPYSRAQLAVACDKWLPELPVDTIEVFPVAATALHSALPVASLLRHLTTRLGDDDDGFARMLLDRYLVVSAELVAAMRCAIADGDAEEVTALAHQLRGASSNLCADHIATLAMELESLSQDTPVGVTQELVHALDRQLDELRETASAHFQHSTT